MRIAQLENTILTESCDGLTADQRIIVEGIYKDLSPLIEASLTTDQINAIFGAVEKNVTAAGNNRSAIGYGVDAAKQVNATINKVGKWLQDTTPVKAFDQKFEQLKSSIGQKFPELEKQLTSIGSWAKDNPGKTTAVIGVLTTIASLAGGPVGGAIAGQILRGVTELLKGEKLSTAIGKGVKAAAYGFLAGKSLEEIGKMMQNGLTFVADKIFPGLEQSTMTYNNQLLWDVKLASQDAAKLETLTDAATKAMFAKDPNFVNLMNKASKFVSDTINQPGYYDNIVADAVTAQKFIDAGNAAAQTLNGIGAAAQGAVTATAGNSAKIPAQSQAEGIGLSETQIARLFVRAERTTEALNEGLWDAVKSKVGQAAGAVANKAQQVGHNITNKVTSDKLRSAWQAAGSPTDSEQVKQVLITAGVPENVVADVYKQMKLTAKSEQPKLTVKQINQIIVKLRLRDLQSLQKTVNAALQKRQKTT
jgi:hypothetical protein